MFSDGDASRCPSIFQGILSNPLIIERLLLIIYSMIFCIGLVGNVMTIVIIKYNTHLRTPTNFYLLNLAVSDLMMLMCNLPIEMLEIYARHWPLPTVFCQLRSASAEFFTSSSILTILAFTCERYLAIVHPIHFHQLTHFRRAQNIIVIIWLVSLVYSLPIGLTYEIDSIIPDDFPSTNVTLSGSPSKGIHPLPISYCRACVPKRNLAQLLSVVMILSSLCFFYFPMLVIGTIYLFIGRALRRVDSFESRSSQRASSVSSMAMHVPGARKPLTITPCHSSALARESVEMKQQGAHLSSYSWLKTRARCQARQVVVKTLVAVVIAFFVCYAPLYLQRLLLAIEVLHPEWAPEPELLAKTMGYFYIVSGLTFYFGSVINPILYNVVSNKYRRAFRDLVFCRLTCKRKSGTTSHRQLFQRNRHDRLHVHYFLTATPQQPPNANPKQAAPADRPPPPLPMSNRSKLAATPSSRSHSSSISSHHTGRYRRRSNQSNASFPRAVNVSKPRKFFGRERQAHTDPWLTSNDGRLSG